MLREAPSQILNLTPFWALFWSVSYHDIAWKNLIQKFISDLFQMFSKNRGIYFLQIYPVYYSLTHYFNHIDVPRGTIDIIITSKISYLSI
jgi:hypothetical protein